MSKNTCFLRHFQIFFNLGAILAHQISNGMFGRSWRIFWHLWHPWGHINSGDISFLVFVFDFSVWQRHLADFFHYSQIEARCHLYWFDMYKSDNIFKVIQAVSVVIWMELEPISPVWSSIVDLTPPNVRTKLVATQNAYSCNKITTTWIQISRQNWNGFFSNASHQIMI